MSRTKRKQPKRRWHPLAQLVKRDGKTYRGCGSKTCGWCSNNRTYSSRKHEKVVDDSEGTD